MSTAKSTEVLKAALELRNIFNTNSDKRICVVGSSCVGKSTLLKYLHEAVDMDDILFGNSGKGIQPKLSQKEIDYVCGPWDEKVGEFMIKKAKENIQIEKGKPVFGTIVFDCDLVVEIIVPDDILKTRAAARNTNLQDVLKLKEYIENQIVKSGKPKIVIENV